MDFIVSVPEYNPDSGITLHWEPGARIGAAESHRAVAIRADRAGLVSLARHLLTLAQEGVPRGFHLHLDDSNGLEAGSVELIFEIE